MNQTSKINGLIAATFTPFHEDGTVNTSVIPAYAAFLKSNGVAGIFVNGSSGEGVLLANDERKLLAEAWAAYGDENFKVIVHVGSTSVAIAKELAAHAATLPGVFAIASMAPNFFPSSEVPIIADYCRQVAGAAPQLPFYYYHLPAATGTHIKVHELLQYAAASIPNLAGVKYTHVDFMDMHQCLQLEGGRFDVLHGHDEILINGLVLGVKGAIGTTFNFMPHVYHRIIAAFHANDLDAARKHQMQSIEIVSIMLRYVNAIVGGKAIMKLAGIDCGPCRTPLRNLAQHEFETLENQLAAAGFFELLKNK